MEHKAECLQEKCCRLGIEFVLLSYSTFTTDCRTCLVPVSALKNVQKEGCVMSPAGYFNLTAQACNFSLIPDPTTLIQLPWNKKLSWVQCNLNYDGKPYELCPRRMLIKQIREAKEAGYVFKSGIEPEFFIINKDGSRLADDIDAQQTFPLHNPGAISRNLPFLTEVFECMKDQGWQPYQIFHEASNGQYEINFGYSEVLITADRLCFLKFMTKQLAEKHGFRVTFMPVPFLNQLCASGMHINMSIWDSKGEHNLHTSQSGKNITHVTSHFIGGLLKYAPAYTAVLCSTVNSYKRLNQASWCPNNITWGFNDKSALIRIPSNDRIEHRLADAASNPHLSHAVLIACGLQGLKEKIDPAENSNSTYKGVDKCGQVPLTLNKALDELEKSEMMKRMMGQRWVEDFVSLKRQEWKDYSKELTFWEKKYYLDC